MRQVTFLLPFALLLAGAPAHAQVGQRTEVAAAAQRLQGRVVEWRRDIHQHPELGNREFRTSALVADHLRSLGLEPKIGIAYTGVVAVLRGGKPGARIAIRADMDALPVTERAGLPFASQATTTYRGESVGVMHACGHDAHTSILMGVAEALVKIRDELPGEVMFIFQPAEEGTPEGEEGGAQLMLKEGLFSGFRPDAVFGLHVGGGLDAGKIAVSAGPIMAASDRFTIVINGRQTHGSQPWGGVDPIVAAADMIGTAQTIVSRRQNLTKQPLVVTFGAIKGGIKANIIPDSVEMVGTIRTLDEGMRKEVFADLKNVAESVARAHGATADARVPDNMGYPVTVNDPSLTERMRPSLEKVVGAANVVTQGISMGSEDFSFYAREVPGMFFRVGAKDPAKPKGTNGHSPEFYLEEASLDVGLRAMLQVTLDYLSENSEKRHDQESIK